MRMNVIILRTAVNAVALWAAAKLVAGITLSDSFWSVVLVAAIFGIVNAMLKPIATLLSLPLIVLTLGLFILVVNATMLGLTAWISGGLDVADFTAAVLGAIVISIVSWLLSVFVPDDDDQQPTPARPGRR